MAVRKSTALADTLQAIADAAPGLRYAGVTRVAVGDIAVELADAAPATPVEDKGKPPEVEPDIGDVNDFTGRRKQQVAS